ncbi:hypothetical protein HELRODRAFT_186288 [Helobdella robusta]|uniref:Uncharacterized protein n=1 Tax=Helobdella robusta TaxID=6412 RepID=T1FNX4_HELRO|nr:hypothetical protein HELRODRAFT_186288 [Helobdella robusta]ESO09767.1 hypothetical protein HELRODRAFT_186288 [Helobdella robusta]
MSYQKSFSGSLRECTNSSKTPEISKGSQMGASKNEHFDPHTVEIDRHHKIFTSLVSGAVAGAVAKTTIAPLDRTKINFQVSTDKRYSFRGAFRFVRRTYQQDGFLALYRGNSATMVRIIPYAAIQYCSFEQYKHFLLKENEKFLPPLQRYLTGSLAGVTAASVTYPLDVARARMAVTQKCTYNTLMEVFMKVYRTEGLLTLYKGFVPSLLGVVPYAGTSFFTYETLKKWYLERTDHAPLRHVHKLCFGALAGLLGQSASYPLDIVRRRMQTAGVLNKSSIYTSLWSTMLYVLKTEGLSKGLYKGLSMNWIKGPIAVGVSFTTYELVLYEIRKYVLHQKNIKPFSSSSSDDL